MQSYEMLLLNKYGRAQWGDPAGRTCWSVLQTGQTEPCAFCTNDKLVDADGNATGVHVWEFQNTVNGRWYQCRDQAIRWTDGRLVRMEIATDITERKLMEEELRQAKQRAEQLANTDELTGLNNRRAFFELGNRAYKQCQRFNHAIAVVMIDIDHFKHINDSYGHSVGDVVLQAFARPLKHLVRDIDVIGRMGGEEFALVLPETDLEEAGKMADRLRIAISSIVVPYESHKISITASMGVAACKSDYCSLENLITKADDALYVAKKKGRNQVKLCH
ncbi:MAG: GGDEF domain-containing protein [Gammaproteobacteria bacterium]|nr:MAG: GGDEF domain-containing protein [Gammaproteobacteria bacterium]